MNLHPPVRNHRLLYLAGLVQIVTLTAGAAALSAPAAEGPPAALEARRNSFSAAVAHKDAAAVAQHFSTQARLIVPGFDAIVGREAIQQVWRFVLSSGKLTRLIFKPDSVEDLGGDQFVETGSLTAFGPDGQESERSHYLFVWQREEGEWRIFRDIVSPGAPVAAPVAAAPVSDRVGFPANYRDKFKMLAAPRLNAQGLVQTAYGNEQAASAEAGASRPYPNGSVLVMEFTAALRGEDGQPRLDPAGNPQRGEISRIDTMRRGLGFGEAYGKNRAGEWEFVSYKPDGSFNTPPAKTASCAECHVKAGAERDFVFPLM